MTTDTWKVNSDGNWSTAADWSRGVIPQVGDSVVIKTTQLHTVTYDSASPSVSVASFKVGDDIFVVSGDSGNTLSITTSASFGRLLEVNAGKLNFNSVNASIASLTQTGGTISGTGKLTVSGAATFGNADDIQTGTGTTLLEGATSDSAFSFVLAGRRILENAGTFNVTGIAAFELKDSTIKNDKGATFDFQTGSTIFDSSGKNSFVNAGTLEQTVTRGTTNIKVTVTNTGTVSVKTGTLELSGGGASTAGTFKVASGATLDFGGGTFALSGGSYDASGTTEISGGTTNFTGATIVSLGALDVTGGTLALGSINVSIASLTQTGGTVEGTGTLTVSGAATFSKSGGEDDVQTGTGTTLLEGVTSDSAFLIVLAGGRILENAGTFNVTGIAAFELKGSTIKNDKGATFDFQTASTIFDSSGKNSFVNAGTLEQTVTRGTTNIKVTVTNSGTISVQSGTLELSDRLTNLSRGRLAGGAYSVSAGSVLELANNATIVTDDANITLRGKGSTIQSFSTTAGKQVSFDSTIRTIGATGQLHLLAGRSLTTAAAAIRDNGLIQLGGGTLTVTGKRSSLTIGAAGKLLGFGVVNATTLANSGLIEASGGTLTVQNAVKGKGGVQIDAKATLVLGGSTASGSTATFNGAGATLTLDKPASFASTIGGFGLDDTLDLVGVTANGAHVNGSNQLVVTENGKVVATLQLSGNNSGFDFVTKAVAGGTDIISLPIPATVADYLDVPADYDRISGGFAISDTAANISAGLNSLNDPKVNSITISDNGAVGVNVAQLTSDAAAIGKLANDNAKAYQLAVTDSLPNLVGDLSGLNGNSHVSSLTATSGAAKLSGGVTVAARAFTLTGSSTALTLAEILTYSGSFSADAGSTVSISSGDSLTLAGTDAFSGATISGAGALDANGTTTVSGLTIGGTATFSDGGTLTESGGSTTLGDTAGEVAKLTIASTGSWDILDDSGVGLGKSTSSSISNSGLFEKTGGTGTSVISANVTNTGTILVSAGTLDLSGPVTGKGTDTISSAATLEFGAGVSTAATLGSQDIGFTGGGTLDLLNPVGFYGEISGFGSGDTVELLGSWAFSGISQAGGLTTLTLASGSTKHGFEFAGSYAESNFSIVSGTTTKITFA